MKLSRHRILLVYFLNSWYVAIAYIIFCCFFFFFHVLLLFLFPSLTLRKFPSIWSVVPPSRLLSLPISLCVSLYLTLSLSLSLSFSLTLSLYLFLSLFHRIMTREQVADMKNSVADRSNAQASCAAQFIGNHIEVWHQVDFDMNYNPSSVIYFFWIFEYLHTVLTECTVLTALYLLHCTYCTKLPALYLMHCAVLNWLYWLH